MRKLGTFIHVLWFYDVRGYALWRLLMWATLIVFFITIVIGVEFFGWKATDRCNACLP